jgi:ankyrin repeat protein
MRKWKTFLAWITFSPDELLLLDKNKQTILHHACLFRAPADVIEMILYAAPGLAGIQIEDGEVALHWAIRLSAPNEVFRMLLKANPASGLHATDRDGNSPLSLLWDRHRVDILEALWLVDRDTLKRLSSWKRLMFLLQSSQTTSRNLEPFNSSCDDDEDESRSSISCRPLHAAARIPCPPGLFGLLLEVYCDSLGDKDEQGRLPLHIASADSLTNRSHDVQTKISMLLSAYPEAAQVPDGNDQLPIHTALGAGVAWDEGIHALFALQPKLISTRDSYTRLYPFMLAAVGAGLRLPVAMHASAASDSDQHSLEHSLSTIYNLLRADPARVRPSLTYCYGD